MVVFTQRGARCAQLLGKCESIGLTIDDEDLARSLDASR
jgi:hypothetical protein